jgi:signal transduction histidine kinase
VIVQKSNCQNRHVDSVLQIVKKHSNDSTGVNALTWLGQYTSSSDYKQSFRYFNQALQLSEKIHFHKATAEIYYELGILYHAQGKYDSALFFHRKVLPLAHKNNNLLSDAYQEVAVTMLWQAQYDSAKFYLTKAQAIAIKNKDYSNLASIYNGRGNIFLQEGNHAEALRNYVLSAKLQDSLVHDPSGESTALANIGNIQYKMGNWDKAIFYMQEAQSIAKKNNLEKVLAYSYQSIGRIYRQQKKLEEAILEYEKALAAYIRMGMKQRAAETYLSIGNIYFDRNNFKDAHHQYTIALQLADEIQNDPLRGIISAALGSASYQLKQYARAFTFTDSARTIGKRINDQYTVLDAYELLAVISKDQHQYKEALANFQQFAYLKDSLNEAGNRIEVEDLEMKYQNEKKTAEIELLKSKQSVQALALSRQRANLIIAVLALISVVIISILLINRYRVIGRTRRLIEMERMRNTIARDLHDDIGSTLSSINIISQMALQEKNGDASHFQRIAQHSSMMMESMSDIVWSINPNNDSWEQVISKMKEFASEILDPLDIQYTFSGEENLQAFTLDVTMRKNLFLIFKEAINNAAKYSTATSINIQLKKENDFIQVSISDNGKGFEVSNGSSGNGLRNMKERANSIRGKLEIKSSPHTGTEISVSLPLT